jgi:hypothetical protein
MLLKKFQCTTLFNTWIEIVQFFLKKFGTSFSHLWSSHFFKCFYDESIVITSKLHYRVHFA